jgi:hypothetical protein
MQELKAWSAEDFNLYVKGVQLLQRITDAKIYFIEKLVQKDSALLETLKSRINDS